MGWLLRVVLLPVWRCTEAVAKVTEEALPPLPVIWMEGLAVLNIIKH